MADQSLTLTINVDGTPEDAFAAIINPRAWWGENITGRTDQTGEEWTYRYKELHESRQKTVELIPGRKVAWQVVDATMSFLRDKHEWKGTAIVFDLQPKGDGTEIRFTHVGLGPTVECFDICSDAWTGLIKGSLKSLIESGRGDPDNVEKTQAA